ncbi:BZ3500_MvSof-1268-A1-R1_Chr11-2g03428 [Microbotryum saponariae]|uniref:BZ3500_MvSof-1268-A1-R1_Chr11-2g03428 protein n=1 Tax=Microbotryum saponariae TaxID=289078 RepID=A0A2X0KQZ9_9BASI|nr:BZ3500_MvSof-1268-A1-R1_Chr11-2g03428 [Microbotryum saponariae]SDA03356.1 BZ3501_MvSof-1269-A2-R1_Chr11g02999 [Microbotryum saponariae]
MSLKRGNFIFSRLGLISLPLDILFLSRASQIVLITLRFTRTGVRITGISIVELLRTAHLLFVYDHLFSLVICGFIEISLEIVSSPFSSAPPPEPSRSISSALSSSTAIGIA